jgi:serine/threonine-protein kinase HipA
MSEIFGFDVFFKDEFGATHLAGRLVVHRSENGGYKAAFSYEKSFRESAALPDLCPFSLPRSKPNPINISRLESGIPFAFEDAIPDAWGKAILTKSYGLSASQQDNAHLLQLIENPIGALSFSPIGATIKKQHFGNPKYLLEEKIKDTIDLSNADSFDKKVAQKILNVGSASGGARPKFIHENAQGHWLVKPSVREDLFPMIRAESLCMKAASMLGLRSQGDEFHQKFQDGKTDVLFVRRFDITEKNGRRHMVSMRSIMGRDGNTAGSYQEMHEHMCAISKEPKADSTKLHRMMLLNCAVGNIDDHLKNFAMLWSASDGWRLAPAYDITPAKMMNPGGGGKFHSIGFFKQEQPCEMGQIPSKTRLDDLGRLMGLSRFQIEKNTESVSDVAQWIKGSMSSYDIHGEHAKAWAEDIDLNLELLLGRKEKQFPPTQGIQEDEANLTEFRARPRP